MNLLDILTLETIKVPLQSDEKRAAIDELVELLADAKHIPDAAELKRVVWERETQRSTGIGEGLAIPHGRSETLKNLVMAVGRPAEPLEFGSIDKKPVRLVVLVASPPDNTKDHIQVLSKINRMMADAAMRIRAYNSESAAELFALFEEVEQ